MFQVTLQLLEDSSKIREAFYLMDNILSEVCKPIRIGASYICSPSKNSLITVYLIQDVATTRFQLHIRIESVDAEELTNNLNKLYSVLKMNNIHVSLVNTAFKSL